MAALPEGVRPRTRAEGYAVQACVGRRTFPLFGWKIAATSKAGQAHIAVDGPLAGRCSRERVFDGGADPVRRQPHARRRSGVRVPHGGRPAAARDALLGRRSARRGGARLHPAIEIPDSRYEDFTRSAPRSSSPTTPARTTSCSARRPCRPGGRSTSSRTASRATDRTDRDRRREGSGANVLGDPRDALAWLVNELSALGVTLRAGQVVTTGTCLMPLPIEPGDRVVDFGVLGDVEIEMGA